MPIVVPPNLVKITETFTLGTAEEISQFSVWGKLDVEPTTPADWHTALDALSLGAHTAWESFSTSGFSPALALADSKASLHDAAGLTMDESVHIASAGDWTGGSANSLPWSTALCVSLYTYTPGSFVPHSARRRGRCYLGPMGTDSLQTGSSGRLSDTLAGNIATHFQTWLHAIQSTAVGTGLGPWKPGVRSVVAGTWNHVTDVLCDDKLDTQRRRIKKETATRFNVSY